MVLVSVTVKNIFIGVVLANAVLNRFLLLRHNPFIKEVKDGVHDLIFRNVFPSLIC